MKTAWMLTPQDCAAAGSRFPPAAPANRTYRQAVKESGMGERLVLGLERANGALAGMS